MKIIARRASERASEREREREQHQNCALFHCWGKGLTERERESTCTDTNY